MQLLIFFSEFLFFSDEIKNGHRLNLKFNFDIREISEVNDKAQSLSIPMYFTVSWVEDRLWINESHPAWNENMTGPLNVSARPVSWFEILICSSEA